MSSSHTANFVDDERFDGLYLQVAATTRGIEPLLDSVFSFLRRKTDFFAGPPGSAGSDAGTDAAMAKVQQVAQKHAALWKAQTSAQASHKTASKAKAKAKAKPASPSDKKTTKKKEDVIEMDPSTGGFDISTKNNKSSSSSSTPSQPAAAQTPVLPKPKAAPPPVAAAAAAVATPDSVTETTAAAAPAPAAAPAAVPPSDNKDDKAPPPPGNGGTVDGKYVWTQSLAEVNMTVPVPEHTRGRDLHVKIAKQHLQVGLRRAKGATPGSAGGNDDWMMVNAPLTKAVIVDDSFWMVEDGNRLVINLQKLHQMEWWDAVCVGDTAIDVKTIQPENSSLNDLDGETRKTVEKVRHDHMPPPVMAALALALLATDASWTNFISLFLSCCCISP
jgi:hypothetical protein